MYWQEQDLRIGSLANTSDSTQIDLMYLYEFVSECPNPTVSATLETLVASWLKQPQQLPQLEALADLSKLSQEDRLQVCWLLASNPFTPQAVLAQLCDGAPNGLLERIAENCHAWPTTLAQLSAAAVAEIRIAAAANRSTPLESVMRLASDEDPDVRYSMAENPNLPLAVLQFLAQDDNPYVSTRAEQTIAKLNAERRHVA